MSRATVICRSTADRQRAASWAIKAPSGTRIEFKAPKRTLPQNDRMWAMLTDVARQKEWAGRRRTANEWKFLFLALLGHESEVVPSLDGEGIVSLGTSSSDLSKEEMSELIDCMAAWGANNGVTFGDEQ